MQSKTRLLVAGAVTRAAATCLALSCALPALAQSPPPVLGAVAPYVVDVGGWAMTPVVTKTGSNPWEVHSFLAIAKAPTGQNLRAIWYVRGTKANCEWTTKTWDTADVWDAIKYVKSEVSIPDDYDGWWATTAVVSSTSVALTPELYATGFKQSDPWGVTITSTADRDTWVEWLEEAGYKCANIPFEKKEASADPAYGAKVLSANAETLDGVMAQTGTPPPLTTAAFVAAAPPVPTGPLPMPTAPRPFPVAPAVTPPSPVIPTSLPGGTPPAPRTLACCVAGSGEIYGFWSGFIEKKNWRYDASCSTFGEARPRRSAAVTPRMCASIAR